MQMKEETEAEAAAAGQIQADQNAAIKNNQAAAINQARPNIIGNVEDMQNIQLAQEEETPHLGGGDVTMD